MTLSDLLTQLRFELSDAAGQFSGDVLWPDEQLTAYLNWSQNHFAKRTQYLRDASTPAVCQIALTPGTDSYKLHPSVLSVLSARLDNAKVSLWPLNYDNLDPGINPDFVGIQFDRVNEPNVPVGWAVDKEIGSITLSPTPQVAQNLLLRVTRLPITPFNVTLTMQACEFPNDYLLPLVDGAAYRALSGTDVDGVAPEQATRYQAKFETAILATRHDLRRLLRVQPRFVPGAWGSW